jgi:pyruvate/2-oxoglutarate dehydrogenase complex dihydrolipoamide acyltransferase (E2) component
MPTKITMPQLGESVSEGTIGHWLKHEGDMVKKDESLVEIITDKVTAELPSPVSGRLTRILVDEDQTVKVGAAIAEIDEAGGAGTSVSSASASSTATPTDGSSDNPVMARAAAVPQAAPPSAGNGSRTATAAVQEKVSPLARRLAQEYQVDLSAIQGTGDGGRVRKEDILAYVDERQMEPAAASAAQPAPYVTPPIAVTTYPTQEAATPPTPPVPARAGDELVTPSPMRRAIAEHMVRSKRTSPHATTIFEVDMTSLARWLERNRESFRQREGYNISYQAFVIKAAVEALKEHPYLNASWTEEGKILLRKQINIGVSIALENNLVVPVIGNTDTLSVAGIARAMSDLVRRARSNRLTPTDMQGATFTVNNPGVFGTLISVAIINQPNAAILTMDGVVKRPVVIEDAIAIRHMMYLSLSFDHRILDGLQAAQFMGAVKRRLEAWNPDADVY